MDDGSRREIISQEAEERREVRRHKEGGGEGGRA